MKLTEAIKHAYTHTRDRSLSGRIKKLTGLMGEHKRINRLSHDDVLKVVGKLKADGLKAATINRYLAIISKASSFYRKYHDRTHLLYIPWQKEGAGRIDYIKKGEEDAAIQYLHDRGRDALGHCIRLLVQSGLRLGEFTSLTVEQVNGDWINLHETKTNKPRSIPLPEGQGTLLRGLIMQGLPKGHTIRRALSDALKATGGNSRLTPHSLRHTTATRLIQSGSDLVTTGKFLGHSSLTTTKRYVHIENADLHKAMKRMA